MDIDRKPQGSNLVPPCFEKRLSFDQCPFRNGKSDVCQQKKGKIDTENVKCSCNCLQFVSWTHRRSRRGLTSRRNIMSITGIRWIAVIVLVLSLFLISVILYKRNTRLYKADHIRYRSTEYESQTERNSSLSNKEIRKNTIFSTSSIPSRREVIRKKLAKRKKKRSLGYPFNPETFDNSTVGSRKYVIVYWSRIRGFKARIQTKKEYEQNPHVWPYTYAGDNCPVKCELTSNRSRAPEASAFVVHSRLTDVYDIPPFKYLAPWILQNNENPVYTPALSDPRIMNKFNLLISYRLDSDFPSPIYPKPSLDPPIPFSKRLGNVLAVFSKCEPVRTEYMHQLMKYIDVHSYGACLKNKKGLIGLYSQINGKYVFKDYKFVMSRYYKFSLVFMNQDCDHFVDDRLYHALETGSIPIYMGTNLIDQFLPGNLNNSIIRASDFAGPKELADYLRYLSNNETAFNKYLEWKWKGLGDYKNTTIGRWWDQKYPLFCQVCMKLSQGNLHSGLDIDKCEPRKYEDWGLEPPYPKTFINKRPEPEVNEQFFMYWKPLFLTGVVFGSIVILMNCCVRCMVHGEKTVKVPL